jgi:hypothetical protein
MPLSWPLEHWLTEAGDLLVRKLAAGEQLMSPCEKAVFEVWLLDTEVRNGGLSQYFANEGLEQWRRCLAAVTPDMAPSFGVFSEQVMQLIAGADNPYRVINSLGAAAENLWYCHQEQVVSELRGSCAVAL